jgi:hypothetical protein
MATAAVKNGARRTLAEEIDRLDRLLDGLADGLNEAVASAVKQAVGPAARTAVREALHDAGIAPAPAPRVAAARQARPAGAGEPGEVREARRRAWPWLVALGQLLGAAWERAEALARTARDGLTAAGQQVRRGGAVARAGLRLAGRFRLRVLAALGLGLAAGLAAFLGGPLPAGLAAGLGCFALALLLLLGPAWRRAQAAGPVPAPPVFVAAANGGLPD